MKYIFLATALLAFGGCSKDDDTKNNCCTDANFKVVSTHANLNIIPPNVITPNGDALNDAFRFFATDRSSSTPNAQITFAVQILKVFRTGTTPVFSSTNYQGEFDGHDNNGAALSEGTYRYELTLDDNTVTGNVCVVRQQSACNCRAIDLNDPLLGTCQ